MAASIETVVAVLRIGDRHDKFGDPYEFAATVIIRGETAEIIGAGGTFKPHFRSAVIEALKPLGVKRIFFDRINHKPRRIVRLVEPPEKAT